VKQLHHEQIEMSFFTHFFKKWVRRAFSPILVGENKNFTHPKWVKTQRGFWLMTAWHSQKLAAREADLCQLPSALALEGKFTPHVKELEAGGCALTLPWNSGSTNSCVVSLCPLSFPLSHNPDGRHLLTTLLSLIILATITSPSSFGPNTH